MKKISVQDVVQNKMLKSARFWFGLPEDIYPVADVYLDEDDDGMYTVVYLDDMARTQEILVQGDYPLANFDLYSSEDAALFFSLC